MTARYYHGGQAGLRVGAFILPPSETSALNTLYQHGTAVVARRDRVYVTTSYPAAVMFAALHPSGGGIYEVEPMGEMTPDPDCDWPGMSWECERARIVIARGVSNKTRRKVLKAVAP
jgi:hypothetical protein